MVKHFPGGRHELHLKPFRSAFDAGAAQVMTCYSIPTGLDEVGASFSRRVLVDLLRDRFGFDGVVCTDFNVLNGMTIPGLIDLPARAWGAEHLTVEERLLLLLEAGVDQLGGETCPELIVAAVHSGTVTEERVDTSARRLLRDKFLLGLFENPFVDVEAACTIGTARELGRTLQRRSQALLAGTPLPDDRPAVLTGLIDHTAILLGSFGSEDDIVLDAVFGRADADGVLPFDLPSSTKAVEDSREDVPFDTASPLRRCGHTRTATG